ncbi:hypothetical protein V1525DRAFT_389312 [Lipomyces kononenkoae]|uniref:Uncharacterized protein n=1 Tax=Lipomyces kononenkoae TaxID=34357 RepID=A0ACC3SZJ2_LIPKO
MTKGYVRAAVNQSRRDRLIRIEEKSTTSLENAEGIMSSEDDSCVDEGSVDRFMTALSGTLEAAVGEDEAVDRELSDLDFSPRTRSQL